MKSFPEPFPSIAEGNGEAAFEVFACTWPPDDDTCDQCYDKYQGRDTNEQFANFQSLAVGIRAVEQPSVELEHGREKSEAFIFAGDLSRILIDEHRGSARF